MPESRALGLAQFDGPVAEVMAEWRIPGVAMAVVRRSKDPLLRCWGLRDIDTGAPVTRDTVFPICSVAKSFTATAIALLVDEGLLDWDTSVRTILPEFRLRDTVATEQASLRDLLTHRTGLPRHDWVHMGGHLDNAGILAALRHLEPSKPFRPHADLLKSVARRVVDRRVLHLIKMWLECPVEEADERGRKTRTTEARDHRRGIPQGSPLSPLLANLYMRRFVLGWKKFGLEKSLGHSPCHLCR